MIENSPQKLVAVSKALGIKKEELSEKIVANKISKPKTVRIPTISEAEVWIWIALRLKYFPTHYSAVRRSRVNFATSRRSHEINA